ncbi:hypothetical protein CLV51_101815 [Chitinophaga niastensis]|uniref:Uncharacterized protein n=1 Tax=Chitinophaga niastensis TaxID=536980 RepID=A0A2P8HTC2_CHINA|nr:hypothetical protein [Chitinophaga niastensis]PSL49481.1 hypothetical protein CLV51_101815 [Chitinophaga niastensis]
MTHKQILDKLAAKYLVLSIDEDLATLTFYAMCYDKHHSIDNQLSYILPKILLRWNCVLNADKNISANYKQKTILALAILLHKYGFADKQITEKALTAIDDLNNAVALSDDFFRKADEIKAFINTTPVPLKKKPTTPENITFYREQDVVAIQLDGKFYAAYIHKLTGPNESPIIEFYDGTFDKVPALEELDGLNARGQVYNDGVARVSLYSISGMKYLPDLANQIQLISACVEKKPSNNHLAKSVGLYAMSDLFEIQDTIIKMFNLVKE